MTEKTFVPIGVWLEKQSNWTKFRFYACVWLSVELAKWASGYNSRKD